MTDEAVARRSHQRSQAHEFTSSACHHLEHQDCELLCPYCCKICRCSCHRIVLRSHSSTPVAVETV